MKNRSLFFKIIFSISVVTIVFMGIFTFQNYHTVHQQLDLLEDEKFASIIKTVEPAISVNYALGLESGYKNAIQQLLDTNPAIINVTLSDSAGNLFYEAVQKGRTDTEKPFKVLRVEMHDTLLGISSGYITVRYTYSRFLSTLIDGYNSFLVHMSLLFIVCIAILIPMIHFALKPLKALSQTLHSYMPGIKMNISPMEGNNEVAIINNATIEMLKKVEEELQKRIKSEKELSHKSRLESMGVMIDNIAHQWRQPLMNLNAIFLNLDRTYELGKLDEAYLQKTIQESTDLTAHMSQTIEDFRKFFRKDNEKEIIDLNETVTYSLKLLHSILDGINVRFKSVEDSTLFIYKNEFIQVIISILTNSIEILNQRSITDKTIFIAIEETPDQIALIIEDNGGGIADEHIDRIFEPYFSTKHQYGGSGLGLYICKMIIEEHMGGIISAGNAPKGAQFIITLNKDLS